MKATGRNYDSMVVFYSFIDLNVSLFNLPKFTNAFWKLQNLLHVNTPRIQPEPTAMTSEVLPLIWDL